MGDEPRQPNGQPKKKRQPRENKRFAKAKEVAAECPSCGERAVTWESHWTGEKIQPYWDGLPPPCGFCGARLVRIEAEVIDPDEMNRT